jgi:DNA-binding NtrC family response regulator
MDQNFEENKKKLLEQISSMKGSSSSIIKEKMDVCIYGIISPFMNGLLEKVGEKFKTVFFDDAETAYGFCIDNDVKVVLLDMDQPTDWKMSTDVFTTVRTAKTGIDFILMTKTPNSVPVETLAAQSALVLVKPFGVDSLFKILKNKITS